MQKEKQTKKLATKTELFNYTGRKNRDIKTLALQVHQVSTRAADPIDLWDQSVLSALYILVASKMLWKRTLVRTAHMQDKCLQGV